VGEQENRCTGYDRSLVKWDKEVSIIFLAYSGSERKQSPLKHSPDFRGIKWIFLAGLLGLFITGMAIHPAVNARAGSDSEAHAGSGFKAHAGSGSKALLLRPLQQQTDYPAQPTQVLYPALTGTTTQVTPETTEGYPASTPEGPTLTATITNTPTETATPAPNTFQTEDSEMSGSKVTPPAGESPSPTAVLTATQSLTPTISASRTASLESAEKQDGFQVNWGMFWMGFALPVVAACGVVLYLLDRRPDLFRPKRK
jgi:hypothetical protein